MLVWNGQVRDGGKKGSVEWE